MKSKRIDEVLNFFVSKEMKKFSISEFKQTHKSLYKAITSVYLKGQESPIWIALSVDDFVAFLGDYTLRAEQMDDWWWWALYKDNEEIDAVHYHDTLPPQSEKEALSVCYESYLKDKIKNIQDEKHIIIR